MWVSVWGGVGIEDVEKEDVEIESQKQGACRQGQPYEGNTFILVFDPEGHNPLG